jgi:hypothetical protein
MNQVGDVTPPAKGGSGTGWQFAVFRAWREREHPQSSYEIAPRVWRPEWQGQAQGVRDRTRQALKNWEPRLTGMAYSDRIVHLVDVVAELRAEEIGRMLYLADLFHRDPDYGEHRSKRVHLVMLARKVAPSVLDLARRRRIRVVVLSSGGDEGGRNAADRKALEVAAPTEHADE